MVGGPDEFRRALALRSEIRRADIPVLRVDTKFSGLRKAASRPSVSPFVCASRVHGAGTAAMYTVVKFIVPHDHRALPEAPLVSDRCGSDVARFIGPVSISERRDTRTC